MTYTLINTNNLTDEETTLDFTSILDLTQTVVSLTRYDGGSASGYGEITTPNHGRIIEVFNVDHYDEAALIAVKGMDFQNFGAILRAVVEHREAVSALPVGP